MHEKVDRKMLVFVLRVMWYANDALKLWTKAAVVVDCRRNEPDTSNYSNVKSPEEKQRCVRICVDVFVWCDVFMSMVKCKGNLNAVVLRQQTSAHTATDRNSGKTVDRFKPRRHTPFCNMISSHSRPLNRSLCLMHSTVTKHYFLINLWKQLSLYALQSELSHTKFL